jgi:hypothetical protein
MVSIEAILCDNCISETTRDGFRDAIADKFFKLKDSGELNLKNGFSIINSYDDNIIYCFGKEYSILLSHGRIMDDVNINFLEDTFYYKYNSKKKYEQCDEKIKKIVEMILNNLQNNNGYSKDMALEIIIYALTENIIEFEKILS